MTSRVANAGHVEPKHLVFLGDLEQLAVREACLGAAEYAAEHKDLEFDPWPLDSRGDGRLGPADLRKVDGLLISERAHEVAFGRFSRIRKPHVFCLATDPLRLAPSVEVDEEMAGRMAAEHLIARGYRTVACILPDGTRWAATRANGFLRACREKRVDCQKQVMPSEVLPTYWRSNFRKRHQEIYRVIQNLPKPCGIFAVNDVIACFIIETVRFYGFNVPHEIGVIGVDDDPVPNAVAGISISSVQLPFREVGKQAAVLLHRMMRQKTGTPRLILPPVRVVVRTSTDTFMVQDPLIRSAQTFIEQHRNRPLRVQEVIKASRSTAMTLGKRFRRLLHLTPSEYIMIRRIEYAKELLRERKLNVEQVSCECGFHSCSYFCQMFRRVAGVTPGECRRIAESQVAARPRTRNPEACQRTTATREMALPLD